MNPRIVLAGFSVLAIASLVGVSIWATSHIGIGDSITDLLAHPAAANNPWLVASLFDAYFGFLWFWLFIALRETAWTARLIWLALLLALGNIAMGAYMLLALRRLPAGAPLTTLFAPARAR